MMTRLAVLTCAIVIAACARSDSSGDGGWRAERESHGDTTVVRTLSGSMWDAPREAIVELTIGTAEGPEETMFGFVTQIAPDSSGGVYVYDAQVPAIRYFDAAGQFVRQVGRKGEGPGEYLDAVLGMAIRSDGRLQIWDVRNRRVTLFGPDGSYSEQWPVPVSSMLYTNEAMLVDHADHSYIKQTLKPRTAGQPWKIGLLHLDDRGHLLDSISEPSISGVPESESDLLGPSMLWTLGRDGTVVVGVNSSYRFEIRKPDGHVVRVERDYQLLAVTDAEHAAYEARREYMMREPDEFFAETSRVKPVYRDLFVDAAGRIWVHRYGPVAPDPEYVPAPEDQPPAWPLTEEKLFDLFEADGSYLGEVRVPHDVNVHHFGLDALWGVREGDQGQVELVRMRFQPVVAGDQR